MDILVAHNLNEADSLFFRSCVEGKFIVGSSLHICEAETHRTEPGVCGSRLVRSDVVIAIRANSALEDSNIRGHMDMAEKRRIRTIRIEVGQPDIRQIENGVCIHWSVHTPTHNLDLINPAINLLQVAEREVKKLGGLLEAILTCLREISMGQSAFM